MRLLFGTVGRTGDIRVEWPAMSKEVLPFDSFQSLRAIRLVLVCLAERCGKSGDLSNGLP